MAKKDTEVQKLEAEIRELKKENRQLLKRLKQVNKGYRKVREEDFDNEVKEIEEPKLEKCPKCSEFKIEEIKFNMANGKVKIVKVCQDCGHRILNWLKL